MSIQSEINRINSNVQAALNTIADTGVSVPENANSDNLPAAVLALANEKQDKLTFDATPTANSTNPVTSGGVKTELDKKASATSLGAHTGNTTVHITAAERTSWNGKADAPKSVSVTLAAASWDSTTKTQTITVTGVSATETAQMITPTPALVSQAAYYEAGILCTGQAADSLTFTATTVPADDLTVYVVIQEVTHG